MGRSRQNLPIGCLYMQDLTPKHAQVHAIVELFPALTGLDLSGKAHTLDAMSCTFPEPLTVFVAGIQCTLTFVCPQCADTQRRQVADVPFGNQLANTILVAH